MVIWEIRGGIHPGESIRYMEVNFAYYNDNHLFILQPLIQVIRWSGSEVYHKNQGAKQRTPWIRIPLLCTQHTQTGNLEKVISSQSRMKP